MIARTSALSNVELPLIYAGVGAKERKQRAMDALDKVGLADRRGHMPSELSGGQAQRVAVARAIVTDPVLLLADEPTGALDSKSTADVLDLFDELAAAGRTIMVITHESDVGGRAQRLVVMRDGRIISDNMQAPDAPRSERIVVPPSLVTPAPTLQPVQAAASIQVPVSSGGGGTHGLDHAAQQARAAYESDLF
jgi:ABC-type methionine transport system ATPase subunit